MTGSEQECWTALRCHVENSNELVFGCLVRKDGIDMIIESGFRRRDPTRKRIEEVFRAECRGRVVMRTEEDGRPGPRRGGSTFVRE